MAGGRRGGGSPEAYNRWFQLWNLVLGGGHNIYRKERKKKEKSQRPPTGKTSGPQMESGEPRDQV